MLLFVCPNHVFAFQDFFVLIFSSSRLKSSQKNKFYAFAEKKSIENTYKVLPYIKNI